MYFVVSMYSVKLGHTVSVLKVGLISHRRDNIILRWTAADRLFKSDVLSPSATPQLPAETLEGDLLSYETKLHSTTGKT